MTRVFLWWIARSTANRVQRQLRRLRNPRYLIAACFGLLYFWTVFGGWWRDDVTPTSAQGQLRVAAIAGPVGLALITAWWWLWGGHRRAILLTPAETNLLLPAPVSRRALIRFKILQAQVPMLFSALFFTLLIRGAPLAWPLRAISLWLMFATLHLHQIGSSLVHAAAAEHGSAGLRRNRLAVLLFSIGLFVLLVSLLRAVAAARATGSLEDVLYTLVDVMSQPAPRIVLAPFRALLAPALAPSFAAWLPAALLVALLLALHYLWVQRSNAAFEETAAAEGARHAEHVALVRSGGVARLRLSKGRRPAQLARPWLPLRPVGRAAYAIFWKNVLYVQRTLRLATSIALTASLIFIVLMSVSVARSPEGALRSIATLLFAFVALVTVTGSLIFRSDLRADLRFLDQLRTYPLRGRDVVAAGVAASTLCMSVTQVLLLVPAILLALVSGQLPAPYLVAIAAAAVLALPILNALSVLIQNAIALLFPMWSRLGENGGGGMENVGHNMVNLIGTVVLLVLAAIPAAAAGALVGAPLAMQIGTTAIVPAALAALAAIAAEVVLATRWLGRLYDDLDPAEAELLA